MQNHQAPPSSQEIKDLILDFRARVDSLRDRTNILIASTPRYTHNPATPDAPLYAQFIGLEIGHRPRLTANLVHVPPTRPTLALRSPAP